MRGIFGLSLQQHLMAGAAIVVVASASPAEAQTRKFDVPAQPASQGIPAFAKQAGVQIIASGNVVRDRRTSAVRGDYTVEEGLRLLLSGTGLAASPPGQTGIITIVQSTEGNAGAAAKAAPSTGDASVSSAPGAGDSSGSPADILVTGSRIKGGVTASPKITITSKQIREEGQSDLGQVIRDIPQNFSGGQNPGVLASAGGADPINNNAGGGSAFNLRGVGPGATLTLLNGKRLSYSGLNNAIDVSAIPVAAVDRIDVITDGASAIYGSDAVAGVVNVILRRDYDGLTAALRGGTTTRGGGSEYQLSLTGGTTWQGGGFLLAYDRGHSDAIFARERTYVIGQKDPTSLYPALSHDSVLLTGHQSFGPAATFSLDALYTRRTDDELSVSGVNIVQTGFKVRGFSISPALDVDLSGGWTGRLTGTYGRDKNYPSSLTFNPTTGVASSGSTGCRCNTTQIAELGVEGPLFELPGGVVRIAAGGGYRRNSFLYYSTNLRGRHTTFGGVDSSSYAYGEMNVPLVSPAMNVAAIRRLSLSAAVRYEKYRQISGTATPKIGLVYEPTSDFSLKGSWGRSFKTATLTQQFQPGYAELEFASDIGGTSYPAGATAIYASGPNPSLRPERAENWTATLGIHPEKIAGLNLEISYFNIDYTDRIVSPVSNFFASLSEPAYAPFVTRAPTAAQISAVLAASSIFYNDAGSDPYAAVAIIDSRLANVSRDHISGVDVSGSYRFALGGGSAVIRGSGSWLKGHRELLKGSPMLQTTGVIFNPPGFHSRAGVTWDKGSFGVAAFVNHLDGVFANYFVVQNGKTGSFDTVDLNIRYAIPKRDGLLSGLEFMLTADNTLDAKPPLFQVSYAGLPNYDSTNYSSIGRKVSLTATKKW